MHFFFFFLLPLFADSCFLSVAHTSWHPCCPIIPPMPFVDTSTHCLLRQLPPFPLLGSSMPATVRVCPRHLVSSFFCFCFVLPRSHSFHAHVSHPHPTRHHPPPPPPVSSGCVNAWASSSTPLVLTVSMPWPRTHYLYYRLDID